MKNKLQKNNLMEKPVQTTPTKEEFVNAVALAAQLSALVETVAILESIECYPTNDDPRQFTFVDSVRKRIEITRMQLAEHPVNKWCATKPS